eukprot:CAMPEP_0116067064 /NCGR_PEP_ID=MMETSP0322-20121206/10776_1 /TAXON_ID=163516 /ORGANISM="Leptocylindrus danicus var. apora, Strain B651" /LENGTH=189 /DNA_ID=CAMNT_0003553779 /DNA_START=90 /DNA_END=659 /DNA_ORIENTATION=-
MFKRIVTVACLGAIAASGFAPARNIAFSQNNGVGLRQLERESCCVSFDASRHCKNSRSSSSSFTQLGMSSEGSEQSNLPMLLDPGTKGGALFLSLVLFLVPLAFYEFVTLALGWDGIDAGRWIGVGFVVITCLLWTSTYIFRVATKDMTYAKQLKEYEDAVIAKRLEELDEDEVQALMEDVEREKRDEF